MAVPTTEFWIVPNATLAGAVDLPTERTALETGSEVSTGAGNEADFGTIDISGGAADSSVLTLLWKCTANGGNTLIDVARLWLDESGFAQTGSVIKVQPLTGDDVTSNSNTESYIASATTGSYTWATMVEADPATSNMWVYDSVGTDDDETSIDITTPGTSDDAYFWAMYAAIASGEDTGTYKGQDSGYELRFNFKYEYS